MKKFPVETVNERATRLSQNFEIFRPEGNGPFAVVFMFHGCGRPTSPMVAYAETLQKAGIAAVLVDSYTPRDVNLVEAGTLICTGLKFHGKERSGDVVAALHWAGSQDWINKEKIGAAGWSHGGWTIMDALSQEDKIGTNAYLNDIGKTPLENLKFAFMVYPWCGAGSYSFAYGWRRHIPAHMIIGGRDMVVGDFFLNKTVERLRRDGVDIETTFFENATHSFDEQGTFHPAQRYSRKYTSMACDILLDFAQRKFGLQS